MLVHHYSPSSSKSIQRLSNDEIIRSILFEIWTLQKRKDNGAMSDVESVREYLKYIISEYETISRGRINLYDNIGDCCWSGGVEVVLVDCSESLQKCVIRIFLVHRCCFREMGPNYVERWCRFLFLNQPKRGRWVMKGRKKKKGKYVHKIGVMVFMQK